MFVIIGQRILMGLESRSPPVGRDRPYECQRMLVLVPLGGSRVSQWVVRCQRASRNNCKNSCTHDPPLQMTANEECLPRD